VPVTKADELEVVLENSLAALDLGGGEEEENKPPAFPDLLVTTVLSTRNL